MAWADLTDKERLELSRDAYAVTVAILVSTIVILLLALNANGGVADCLPCSGPELSTSGLFFWGEL